MSLISLRSFFDLPARPTKIDQKWKFLTSVFFVRFGWNLVWGLIMGQKQHRMSLKCPRPFFDLPAWPTKIDDWYKESYDFYFPIIIWSDYSGDSPQLYSVADHYSFPDFFATKQLFKRVCLSVRPSAGPYITLLLFGVLVLGPCIRVSLSQHFKIVDRFKLIMCIVKQGP